MLDRADARLDQLSLREQLAAAYSSGALDPAMQLLVETQASLLPRVADDLTIADALIGVCLEAEAPAPMSAEALESAMARVASDPRQDQPLATAMRSAAARASAVLDEILRLPYTVHDAALEALGRGGWTFAGPGMRTLALEVGSEAKAELIRIEPGWGAPRHNHKGGEYTLVLAGAFSDERGAYGVGDIAFGGPGITHRPVAKGDEVCYSLAVTEAAPVFTGALGLLQRIWRH